MGSVKERSQNMVKEGETGFGKNEREDAVPDALFIDSPCCQSPPHGMPY